MQQAHPADLITEAERYLAAVAVFRSEGCEPKWRLEPGVGPRRRRAPAAIARDLFDPSSRRLE
jgi:hypothetical protein